MEEDKAEYEKNERELMGRVASLDEDVRRSGVEAERWMARCDTVERMLAWEQEEKGRLLEELRVLRFGNQSAGTEAVPLPPRRQHQQRQQPNILPQKQPEPYSSSVIVLDDEEPGCGNCDATTPCVCMEQAIASMSSTCGKCTPGTNCECADAVFSNLDTTPNETDHKRPHSPSQPGSSEKRQRQEEPLEIDFTAQFARPTASLRREESSISFQGNRTFQPIEPCGFCKDGTYCACLDLASSGPSPSQSQQQQQQLSLLTHRDEMRLPPLLHEVTPPPSDEDIDGKLPVWDPRIIHRAVDAAPPLPAAPPIISVNSTDANPCAGGPGTCKQCLSDPRSRTFCQNLAKIKAASSTTTSSSFSTSSGCCMDIENPPNTQNQNSKSSSSYTTPIAPPQPRLSCAQAYQTLSTHSAFDRAAAEAPEEMITWLCKLRQIEDRGVEGRGPLEVEAASVMEVLKHFDRRFGSGT